MSKWISEESSAGADVRRSDELGCRVVLTRQVVDGRSVGVSTVTLADLNGGPVAVPLDVLTEVAENAEEWLQERQVAEVLGDLHASGTHRRSELFRAEIAEAYTTLTALGQAEPVRHMAWTLGVTPNVVSSWLRRARTAGLLTSAGPGRAGGELTDKARALLSDDHDEGA